MPSASPSARTDCPSTASRGDGQQTRHESGQPCRLPQETHDTPSTTARRIRRPYAASLPAQIKQTEPAGEREDIRRGRRRARREKGRKDEDLRPLACRFAVKVIYRPNPAPKRPAQHRPRPAGTPARTGWSSQPPDVLPPVSISVNSVFGEFAEPRPVFARQQTNNGTPPACLDATGTGGAFTFSRPPRFSRNGLVPLLYHVHPISPFFTREQSRRFPNSK